MIFDRFYCIDNNSDGDCSMQYLYDIYTLDLNSLQWKCLHNGKSEHSKQQNQKSILAPPD